ncbi:hypothetical protein ACOI1H_20755 [Loktanella sp. DJP18]|uniref:hypothetical protein n=1 Tax=Loktanella sp. DJP18 TaxID=3409788 RepID=UPI003BB63B81
MVFNDKPPLHLRIMIAIQDWDARRQGRKPLPLSARGGQWIVALYWRQEIRHHRMVSVHHPYPATMIPFVPTAITQKFYITVSHSGIESMKIVRITTPIEDGAAVNAFFTGALEHGIAVKDILKHPDLQDYDPFRIWHRDKKILKIEPGSMKFK